MKKPPLRLHIAVAGASGLVGRGLIPLLRARGHRITALIHKNPAPVCDRTLKDWTKRSDLARQLETVDVVVNLAGTLNPGASAGYARAICLPARRLAAAFAQRPRSFAVMLSCVGAGTDPANALLKAKAEAEGHLRLTAARALVLRASALSGGVLGPSPFDRALMAPPGQPLRLLGCGTARLRPVYLGDVLLALLAAIERQDDGIHALEGPGTLRLADFARITSRAPLEVRPSSAWLARRIGPLLGLRRALVDFYTADRLSEDPPFWPQIGIQPRAMETIWAEASAARAAGVKVVGLGHAGQGAPLAVTAAS